MKSAFRTSVLTLMAVLSFAMMSAAQTSPSSFPGINIRNFGQMTDNLYRGGQPTPDDYKALASFGIKTVIDLRSDHETYAESAAEAAGLKYYLIPMNGVSAPSDADVAEFLRIVNDPASGKVYFHCKAGIHRTGTMGAVYRINHDGWDYDKAYTEMKNYQFSAGLFHGGLKKFVQQYADEMSSERAAAAAKAPVVASAATTAAVTVNEPITTTPPVSIASLLTTTASTAAKMSVTTTDLTPATKTPSVSKRSVAAKTTAKLKRTFRAKKTRTRRPGSSVIARR